MQANVFPVYFQCYFGCAGTLCRHFATGIYYRNLRVAAGPGNSFLLCPVTLNVPVPAFGKNHGYPVHRKSRMVVVVYVLSAFAEVSSVDAVYFFTGDHDRIFHVFFAVDHFGGYAIVLHNQLISFTNPL